jgi:hypothetical protein
VVITADHGMTNLNQSVKRIYLKDYINLDDVYRIVDYGVVVGISAMDGRSDAVIDLQIKS